MANTPRETARLLAEIDQAIPAAIHRTLTSAAERLQADARAMVGTEPAIWPALATATIAQKQRLGFTGHVSPTDPLLRTGQLRESITATADPDGITLASSDPVMTFHEHGTARMPARPVLAPTIAASIDEIGHALAGSVAETIRTILSRRK